MTGITAGKENRTKFVFKRALACILAFALIFGAAGTVALQEAYAGSASGPQLAYIKPDVTIVRNGEILNFFNESGVQVYPVFFQSRTYLPLRAICGILGEEVEWVGAANTIYIGMTLSHPSKSIVKPANSPFVKTVSNAALGTQSIAKAYIKDSIYIMKDFEAVTFADSEGNAQYPINVGGTTYLPISALGTFLGENISWDGATKTVILGSRDVPAPEPEKDVKKDERAERIAEFYEQQAKLYDEATELILLISSSTPEELNLLATEISQKYLLAEQYNRDVKSYAKSAANDSSLTDEEADALGSMCEFAEFSEHYLLVMENMMCLAAQGQDYSSFAEIFLNFAMMTQSAMDSTAKKLEPLL